MKSKGIRHVGIVALGASIVGCLGGESSSNGVTPAAATGATAQAPSETPATPPAPPAAEEPLQGDPEPLSAPAALGARVALWLRGDEGVTATEGAVTAWADQSPHENDAHAYGAVTFAATSTIANAPAIRFDGKTGYLAVGDSPSLHFGTEDLAGFVVFSHASPTSTASRMLFSKQSEGWPYRGFGVFANWNNGWGIGGLVQYPTPSVFMESQDVSAFTEKPVLAIVRRTGDTLSIATSDAIVSQSALSESSPVDLTNSASLRIGGQGGEGQTLTGDIAEIVIVRGAMADTEVRDVAVYLRTKYWGPA